MTPDEINRLVGTAIRNRRTLLGLSQEKLAKPLGVTFQQVQKYENGSNQLTIARALQVADALGWTLTELIAAALNEAPAPPAEASDRATLEFAKRFAALNPHEQRGVSLLVRNLAGAA